jgi:hypothetical protein
MSCEEVYNIYLTEVKVLQLRQPLFEWYSDSCFNCIVVRPVTNFDKLLVGFNVSGS